MTRILRQLGSNFVVAALLMALVLAFSVAGNVGHNAQAQTVSYISTTVNLQTSPSDADFDYWAQIVQHRIPEIRDGAARYFPGGRYYLGQNGFEVRLTNRTTQIVFAATGGAGGSFGRDVVGLVTPMVRTALQSMSPAVRDSLTAGIGGAVGTYLPGDQCLGFTLPPAWVANYLNNSVENLQAVTNGQIPFGFGYNVPVWLEQCG